MTEREQKTRSSSWVRPATVAFLLAMAVLGVIGATVRSESLDDPAGSSTEVNEVPATAFGA
jgi:hypothetical protein